MSYMLSYLDKCNLEFNFMAKTTTKEQSKYRTDSQSIGLSRVY